MTRRSPPSTLFPYTTLFRSYLGAKADSLLGFKSPKIAKERLHLPGPDFVDRIYAATDRNLRVLTNLQRLFGHGRLSGRSEEHTSELQSRVDLVCRLLLEKKK